MLEKEDGVEFRSGRIGILVEYPFLLDDLEEVTVNMDEVAERAFDDHDVRLPEEV